MTIGDILSQGVRQLTEAGIETARLDCLILLEDATGMDRAQLIAHPEASLTEHQTTIVFDALTKRQHHMPLAYIRGKVMFYGREFMVNERVLVPRPETETIIELLKTLPIESGMRIADIGTGSGCIGITAALELPSNSVMLYDIDDEALAVARANGERLGAQNAAFSTLNVLTGLPEPCDIVLTNLPYVPENYPINDAAGFEPKLALFSGPDGLDHYRAFWKQLGGAATKPHYIITEALPSQHHALAQLARHGGYVLEKTDDFIQLFSV
jgi:release factor glutamine methyltransferase